MRRDPVFWIALAVAFVLGLLPGLGLMVYQRRSTDRTAEAVRAELNAKRAAWEAERRDLAGRATSAETSVTMLEADVASLTVQVTRLKSVPPEEPPPTPKKPPVILERTVEGSATAGKPIALVVKVKGEADKVTMRIARTKPDTGWVKTYALEDAGVSGGVHVWRTTITAPAAGEYRYFADAYLDETHVSMPGVSAWTFLVE